MAFEKDLQQLLDEHAIRKVLMRYCRGIDRRDFDLVRSCYHTDGTDNHGTYQGSIAGFIDYLRAELPRYEQTMHVVANVLIELEGECAWSEAYTIAHHRLHATATKPHRDYTVGLRYVDRFERREDRWAIVDRQCVFSWSRMDSVPPGYAFPTSYTLSSAIPTDPIYQQSFGR